MSDKTTDHKPKNPEQTNNPDDFTDPGKVTPEELAAHDAAVAKNKALAHQAETATVKHQEEGGPGSETAYKGDGSLTPAFETNTPTKAPDQSFRDLLMTTLTGEIGIVTASMGISRGNGTEKQQESLLKLLELGIKLSNDDV